MQQLLIWNFQIIFGTRQVKPVGRRQRICPIKGMGEWAAEWDRVLYIYIFINKDDLNWIGLAAKPAGVSCTIYKFCTYYFLNPSSEARWPKTANLPHKKEWVSELQAETGLPSKSSAQVILKLFYMVLCLTRWKFLSIFEILAGSSEGRLTIQIKYHQPQQ